MLEKHTQEQVLDFLKHNPHGVLATASLDGKPWSSSIYFVTDENFNFFFITRKSTEKHKNINTNPNAALTVTDHSLQRTAQISGKVSKIPSQDIVEIMKKLSHVKPHGDNKWVPPIVKVHGGDYVILRLKPDFLQFADYKQTSSEIHEDFIERII